MHIDEALDLFLVQLEADGRSVHTIGQYRRHVRLLARWLATEGRSADVTAVTHGDIARFLASPLARARPDGRPKKATAMNALRTSVRCFAKYLHEAGVLAQNPARLVRRAVCSPPPPRALSPDEQRRLLAALEQADGVVAQRDHALFHLLLATGIRLGSALALRVEDVDLDARELVLRLAKNGRPDRVFLSRPIAGHLRRYIRDRTDGWLFPGRNGGALCARQARVRLGVWLRAAGIRRAASPHSLRHTFATDLYRRTGDVLLVREALRHRSITSTLVYATADERRVRRAIEAS